VGASQDLQNFLRSNKQAWRFAWKATDDYLLARFGMLNGLWSSFEMATQATEKLLKGYLLFTDSALCGDADKVRRAVSHKAKGLGRRQEFGHDIEACIALASAAGLPSSTDLSARLVRIKSYYSQRYPDTAELKSLSAGEVDDVDRAIFEIWDAFKTINGDYYYTCGVSMPVYAIHVDRHGAQHNPISQHVFQILTFKNKAYEMRQHDLEAGIEKRLAEWYPSKSSSVTTTPSKDAG
jgi:hypothetical protein